MATTLNKMVQINYIYQGDGSKRRNGSILISAPTIADATAAARKNLSKEYDWFKITKATLVEGDQAQQAL